MSVVRQKPLQMEVAAPLVPVGPQVGVLHEIRADGVLRVSLQDGDVHDADWLISPLAHLVQEARLAVGDAVLVLVRQDAQAPGRLVVMGKIGPYQLPRQTTLAASEALTLQCGQASVALRSDGRMLVKGSDVTLQADGTQRIRAGNVAIN